MYLMRETEECCCLIPDVQLAGSQSYSSEPRIRGLCRFAQGCAYLTEPGPVCSKVAGDTKIPIA